jgi:hypothetical protein
MRAVISRKYAAIEALWTGQVKNFIASEMNGGALYLC